MKRMVIIVSVIAIFCLIMYGWVWISSYQMSKHYYAQAQHNIQKQNYSLALKGTPSTNGGAHYQGGLEQVVDCWSSFWAYPKPRFYQSAKKQLNTVIHSKLSLSDSENILHTYLNLDNQYLPQILLAVGEKSEKKGDISTAKQAYQSVISMFKQNKAAVNKAKKHLKKLNQKSSSS